MVPRYRAFAAFLFCIAFLASCTAPRPSLPEGRGASPTRKPAVDVSRLERKIHDLIDLERRKQGLKPLDLDPALSRIARAHSRDMADRKYFSHDSPEGEDFSARYRKAGYRCSVRVDSTIYMGGENIALNNLYSSMTTVNGVVSYDWNSEEKIARTTVQGWMDSAGHRKNILTPHFRKEGIGVHIAPDDRVYITQNFC